MSKGSKVIKSGTMTPVRGGPSGKIGKQGGSPKAVAGKVTVGGNNSSSGKFIGGGPSGKVGNQKPSRPSVAGRVTVSK